MWSKAVLTVIGEGRFILLRHTKIQEGEGFLDEVMEF